MAILHALALAALQTQAAPASLLDNGGFEKGLAGWTLLNNSGNAKAELDAEEKKEGKQSLRFSKTGGMPMDVVRADVKSLPKGATVVVSAQVRADAVKNAWFKFFLYDDAGESLVEDVDVERIRGSSAWRRIEKSYEIPEKAATATVFVLSTGDGTIWLDDVRVTPSGPKPVPNRTAPPKPEPLKPLDAKTKAWLDANAAKVRTLELDGALDDLAPLKKALAGARIVQLGEQSHGDGETFRAKARLARFLHEEMGFDVIAFESGLFECDRANARLKAGDASGAMDASVFRIWRVKEVRPLFRYLAERAKTDRPFMLAGFDTRASGAGAEKLLDELFEHAASFVELSDAERAALKTIDKALGEDPYKPADADRKTALAALERLRAGLDAKKAEIEGARGAEAAAFFSRCLDNFRARERFELAKADASLPYWASTNLRDAQMADNLKWLAEVRFPGKKIVCWGASMHFMHGSAGVREGGKAFYDGCAPMGEATRATFGDAVYTIGFVAHHGTRGMPWTPKGDVPKAKAESVEDWLHRYGAPLLFADLRKPGPLDAPRVAGPLGYSAMEASWPKVFDGLFFTDAMTPSSR
ncbi:MAG TPA: erythromycin esterase family protein [Planctomycetota bacterium]|nr:erythromycin esterase family protein [Planctomycetota bacterium]